MRVRRNRGVGDWFAPDCQPGTADCVPHWYCYVPGAATPDCLASLGVGLNQIGQAVGSTVGTTAGAVSSGVLAGAGSGLITNLFSTANCAPTDFWCNNWFWILGAAGVAALVISQTGGRRR